MPTENPSFTHAEFRKPKPVVVLADTDLERTARRNRVLSTQGLNILPVSSWDETQKITKKRNPEIAVIDVDTLGVSPKKLERFSASGSTSVLVISCRNNDSDQIAYLDSGARFFLPQTIGIEALGSHIRAAMRSKEPKVDSDIVTISEDLKYQRNGILISNAGNIAVLSPQEQRCFKTLLENRGKFIDIVALKKAMDMEFSDDNFAALWISRIRKKIKKIDVKDPIENVHSLGYRFLPSENVNNYLSEWSEILSPAKRVREKKGKVDILAVGDQSSLSLLRNDLSHERYSLTATDDVDEAQDLLDKSTPDFILTSEGVRVTPRDGIRNSIPWIALVDNEFTGTALLKMGVSGFVEKPMVRPRISVLTATMDTINRRPGIIPEGSISGNAGVEVDVLKGAVYKDDVEQHLTRLEFKLISYLALYKGTIVSSDTLSSHIWGSEYLGYNQSLLNSVSELRKKIGHDVIQNVRGKGYVFF